MAILYFQNAFDDLEVPLIDQILLLLFVKLLGSLSLDYGLGKIVLLIPQIIGTSQGIDFLFSICLAHSDCRKATPKVLALAFAGF